MTTSVDSRGLAQAGCDVAAMTAAGGHACITVRSHRSKAAEGTRSDTPLRIRRTADRSAQTTSALVLVERPQPGEPPLVHTAFQGYGTRAVRAAARLAVERLGHRWPGQEDEARPDVQLVSPPRVAQDPALFIEEIIRQVPRGGALEISAQAHAAVESRLLVPANGQPMEEILHTGAVVVDILKAGVQVADADLAWSGTTAPDLGRLGEHVAQVMRRVEAPSVSAPPHVQMLLLDGSAGAFLHEVCGHLLESTRQRPSLLAGRRTQQVAHHLLSVDDNPRHIGGFGSHCSTIFGTETRRRPLLVAGQLAGLLEDTPDGPWRAEGARHIPQPRMTHLELAPAPSSAALDRALGDACAPVVRVHRLGFGSLDHRDGTVILEVKDATYLESSTVHRLAPFLVTAEARQLLMDVRAVGCAATTQTWSAYCLATSGSLPVGASTPTMLTGPLSTLHHRPLALPHPAFPTSA